MPAPGEPTGGSLLSVEEARALLRCEVRAAIRRRVEAPTPGAYSSRERLRPYGLHRRREELWRLEDAALAVLRGEDPALFALLPVDPDAEATPAEVDELLDQLAEALSLREAA